jgi:hypothetical protein
VIAFGDRDEAYSGFYNTDFHRLETLTQNIPELDDILTLILDQIQLLNDKDFEKVPNFFNCIHSYSLVM